MRNLTQFRSWNLVKLGAKSSKTIRIERLSIARVDEGWVTLAPKKKKTNQGCANISQFMWCTTAHTKSRSWLRVKVNSLSLFVYLMSCGIPNIWLRYWSVHTILTNNKMINNMFANHAWTWIKKKIKNSHVIIKEKHARSLYKKLEIKSGSANASQHIAPKKGRNKRRDLIPLFDL